MQDERKDSEDKQTLTRPEAALKIQKFWRANSFFTRFLALRAASYLEIQKGSYDTVFNKMLNYCNKEIELKYDQHAKNNLKMIVHALLVMEKADNYTSKNTDLFNTLLLYLFADKKSSLTDIIQILKDFHSEIHLKSADEIKQQREVKLDEFNLAKRKAELAVQDKETYWGEKRGVKKTDMITIVHWGGLLCIRGLIYRQKPGYRLEHEMGLGLQVTPFKGEISLKEIEENANYWLSWKYCNYQFAFKAQANFDIPARLYAQVEAQYILPAKNDYEGGFPSLHAGYLKNIAIHTVHSLDSDVEYRFKYWGEKNSLLSLYSGQTLFKRLEHTVDKISELHKKSYEFKTTLKLGW